MGNETFTLKPEHLKLLSEAYVSWDDGAFRVEIDCKCPHGNRSLEYDIGAILGVDFDKEDDGDWVYSDTLREQFRHLYLETETALQVVLRTQSFIPGDYAAPKYTQDWELVRALERGENA